MVVYDSSFGVVNDHEHRPILNLCLVDRDCKVRGRVAFSSTRVSLALSCCVFSGLPVGAIPVSAVATNAATDCPCGSIGVPTAALVLNALVERVGAGTGPSPAPKCARNHLVLASQPARGELKAPRGVPFPKVFRLVDERGEVVVVIDQVSFPFRDWTHRFFSEQASCGGAP